MKKKTVSGLLLTLFMISVLTSISRFHPVKAEPTTIVVPDDYPTIQGAINAADPGDTIYVKTGTYYEHILVDKAVHIIGEANDLTRVDGSNTGFSSVFEIKADNVEIRRFTLRCVHTWGHGVSIWPFYSHSTIEETIITSDTRFGIWTIFTSNGVFRDNIISAFERGITLNFSKQCILENNLIQDSDSGIVIGMVGSENNIIRGNNLKSNKHGIVLLDFPQPNQQANMIYHNNFVGNTIQVFFSEPYTNIWDDGYPSGGNYWSDYVGEDGNDDGIGDTPYIIDTDDQDNYPLMEPWSLPTMTKALIRTVKFWSLPKGTENSLTSKLEGTRRHLDTGRENGAVYKLMSFVNHVKALEGRKLTDEQANYLISKAQRIIDLIKG